MKRYKLVSKSQSQPQSQMQSQPQYGGHKFSFPTPLVAPIATSIPGPGIIVPPIIPGSGIVVPAKPIMPTSVQVTSQPMSPYILGPKINLFPNRQQCNNNQLNINNNCQPQCVCKQMINVPCKKCDIDIADFFAKMNTTNQSMSPVTPLSPSFFF